MVPRLFKKAVAELIWRFHSDQRGQGMAEYIALVILVSLVCIPLVTMLPEAVRGYVRPFYYCLSRPIP